MSAPGTNRRLDAEAERDDLTHYLFRFPARFHPPVVRALLAQYTRTGDLVLDPFCGSGTLLVEALVNGRAAIGLDIDPLAVAVSRAKIHRYSPAALRRSADQLLERVEPHRRPSLEYDHRKFHDLTDSEYEISRNHASDWIPDIPNLSHWFRRYVTIDLARIRKEIARLDVPRTHKLFFQLVFASIIRNASNADPVPVSGPEVTSHMKRRDQVGRVVHPFALFDRALRKALIASAALRGRLHSDCRATAMRATLPT